MYTILMNSDKSLSKTVVKTLFQGENLVDKFRFLIPKTYNGLKLSDFTTTLKYIDQGNTVHSEKLALSDELYQNRMLCFYLPVDSELTKFAGNITIHLVLNKGKQHILHSGETTITINAVNPCYQHLDIPSDNPDDGTTDSPNDGTITPSEGAGFEVVEF